MSGAKTSARWLRGGIIGTATLAMLAVVPAVAHADSPLITASNGQCGGKWYSGPNDFRIWDLDLADDDYCYIHYSFQSDHDPFSRIALEQDSTQSGEYHVLNPEGRSVIYWNLCKERQNDNDICAGWRSDLT